VGAGLCVALAGEWEVVALDNLRRRGSELNLARLREAGVRFVHGDVRVPEDLLALGSFDALVECSAEPSVLAGVDDDVVRTNLIGAYHCLELARRDGAQLVFLSTSRVYPLAALGGLALRETGTRFELAVEQATPGASAAGIAEDFPLEGARTFYGATKLAAEHLITEYAHSYGLRASVLRCGVIVGPWQMGKSDQGVFSHWLLAHRFGRPLAYYGYGGSGKQVRDLLHVDDLVALIAAQLRAPEHWAGTTFNVGGGREGSLSLLEATALCRELTGREVPVTPVPEGRPGDAPVYLSDTARLLAHGDWRPQHTPASRPAPRAACAAAASRRARAAARCR